MEVGMSSVTTVYCDRCGREIKGFGGKATTSIRALTFARKFEYELCMECSVELADFILGKKRDVECCYKCHFNVMGECQAIKYANGNTICVNAHDSCFHFANRVEGD